MSEVDYLAFGTYQFPPGIRAEVVPGVGRFGAVDIPRREGVAVGTQFAGARVIGLRGMLYATATATVREQLDELSAAIHGGRDALYIYADRYIWATMQSISVDYEPWRADKWATVAIDFLCDTGLWESDGEYTETFNAPESGTAETWTPGGNAVIRPQIKLKVATSGTADWSFAVNDYEFTVNGAVTDNQVLVIDCDQHTVALSTGTDKISLFDGEFPQIDGGAENSITWTKDSGDPTVSRIEVVYRERWY